MESYHASTPPDVLIDQGTDRGTPRQGMGTFVIGMTIRASHVAEAGIPGSIGGTGSDDITSRSDGTNALSTGSAKNSNAMTVASAQAVVRLDSPVVARERATSP